jgi:CheY-like chemotaxis protein
MAIVRHLVELHGGTVRAHSEGENKGATFVAVLPTRMDVRARAASPSMESAAYAQAPTEDLPHLDGISILVVDDEPDSRGFLCTLLENQGATVACAGSTQEALEEFGRTKPDVLVSDIGMPGEDGYDLIRKVRALPPLNGGRTPAVALTAYVRAQDARAALRAGYQRHIGKPVVISELIAAVADLAAADRVSG